MGVSTQRVVFKVLNGLAVNAQVLGEKQPSHILWMVALGYRRLRTVVGKNSRRLVVTCCRSRAPEAIARTSCSHSGPSGPGSIPFRRRKTIQLPSPARLLPSMKG